MDEVTVLLPGQRVVHPEFGEGVVIEPPIEGYARVFFPAGERQVAISTVRVETSRAERLIANVAGTPDRPRKAWLAYEAHALPLMESAAALTSARIDLLPHQVVLTHRIATGSPRRYLVADEVGLGKTIETALVLRELASRNEMRRALMVVPAGLVNNWARELNDVFHLDFEIFGSEGDVTDRKSNAFAKHHRLIASIDTLKRPARIRRLLEAPPWDLVVFDEAHHLTAYKSGGKIKKTENYKLAEALRGHARDLLLLSATPHQGDHFRFWMLVQLLNPTLFNDAQEMVENRHRLNAVVFRRTKADACKPDGSPLFARRFVHTESFLMSDTERRFYEGLRQYLEDGFALAKRKGKEGNALGFVMAVFQKIAASSFSAVRRTLRRRLLTLTLHEAILKDRDLDIEGRQALYEQARQLIREEYQLGDDPIGRGEVDQVLADLKLRLVRRLDDEELEALADPYAGEREASRAEDAAVLAVSLALPEERQRIRALLEAFPAGHETKCEKLLRALGTLWRENPNEKVVVFATYLGTVDLIGQAIDATYPGQGVVVLRGGDHGAKVAAERRFKQKEGPKVIVCTAAGREGINLQHARILFNFDLPWNPMDVEQRIGRIHRYGQNYTAQVYNLVLSDTIEGRIFLLLDAKLQEIARALGKVDEQGNVAEDLRSQILGQLSERLSYEKLYQEALSDPELKRTRQELEAALTNATEARKVVFELFQDLEGFSLEDYKPFADLSAGVERIVRFVAAAREGIGERFVKVSDGLYELQGNNAKPRRFTTQRETAREREDVELLGLDHPIVEEALVRWRALSPEEVGVSLEGDTEGVVSSWVIHRHGKGGDRRSHLLVLGVALDGTRSVALERRIDALFGRPAAPPVLTRPQRLKLLADLESMLRRELLLRGIVDEKAGYSADLIGWMEVGVGARVRPGA
jgi:superfamily II DNA or RNA helicase